MIGRIKLGSTVLATLVLAPLSAAQAETCSAGPWRQVSQVAGEFGPASQCERYGLNGTVWIRASDGWASIAATGSPGYVEIELDGYVARRRYTGEVFYTMPSSWVGDYIETSWPDYAWSGKYRAWCCAF